jgi:hypothetical protein
MSAKGAFEVITYLPSVEAGSRAAFRKETS